MVIRIRDDIRDKLFKLKFNIKDVLPSIRNTNYYINEIDTFGRDDTPIINMIYTSFKKEAIKVKSRIIFNNKSMSINAEDNDVILTTLINGEFTQQKFSVCDPHKFADTLQTIKDILAE